MQPGLPDQILSYATKALAAGKFAAAEIACRDVIELEPRSAPAWHMLGYIAAQMGMRDAALSYFQTALDIEPGNDRIRENLSTIRNLPQPSLPPADRYLLIKSWGCGFWADMVQVLGSLLLAEITGRIPLVYWGADSLFSDKSGSDAFAHYFEPVSPLSLQQLAAIPAASFFPPRWNVGNLTQSGISKWEGKGSRAGVVFFFNRPETIAVSDFHIGVVNVMPWIAQSHPLHGKSLEELYRYLTQKYLRPQPDIVAAADAFFAAHLAQGPFVAVHMRGSDKANEDPDLDKTNQAFQAALDTVDPSWPIFLMTDDAQCLARMRGLYGRRIVATDCQRTDTAEGVHYLPTVDPVRAGKEILIDSLLALRAARFIGNGRSNVSAMIAVMKDWAPGCSTLIGRSVITERNLYVHELAVATDGS